MKIFFIFFVLAAISISLPGWASEKIIGTRVNNLNGDSRSLGLDEGKLKPVALVFMDPICPISRKYVPLLNEKMMPAAKELGFDFYGVISNQDTSVIESKKFVEEYAIRFPVLFDATGDLAERLKPTHMPEAFVIAKNDILAYRGRIDNRFAKIGVRRPQASSSDLLNAIRAVASGKKPNPSKTDPIGCIFENWPEVNTQASSITYNRDIAPILNAHCIECHHTGGVAPFPLQNYKQAKRKAKMSASVTKKRIMPPWKAKHVPGNPRFRNERLLSDRQIALINAWAENGAPEGKASDLLPPPKMEHKGWRCGKPDLVVTMPEAFEVPADGPDIYRYFVIPCPPTLQQDRVLTGIDFKPGDPSVVHHSDYFVDYSGKARKAKSNDGKAGFSITGVGGFLSYFDSGFLGAWAPGSDPYQLAKGQGIQLKGGGDIVLEIHYHPTGKTTSDKSSLAFYFAKEETKEYVGGLFIGSLDLKIPANTDDYWREVWMDIPTDIRLLDIGPHMHYLGKESHIAAILPNGRKLPLLSIDDWDLNWQTSYFYRDPVFLPKGSQIRARFKYDNTAQNPLNPHSPPRKVEWGWSTDEEMCEVYMTVIANEWKDWPKLTRNMEATWYRSAEPKQ